MGVHHVRPALELAISSVDARRRGRRPTRSIRTVESSTTSTLPMFISSAIVLTDSCVSPASVSCCRVMVMVRVRVRVRVGARSHAPA